MKICDQEQLLINTLYNYIIIQSYSETSISQTQIVPFLSESPEKYFHVVRHPYLLIIKIYLSYFIFKRYDVCSLIRLGPKVIKLFPYSIQLSTKFILLINVKMPTVVGTLTCY